MSKNDRLAAPSKHIYGGVASIPPGYIKHANDIVVGAKVRHDAHLPNVFPSNSNHSYKIRINKLRDQQMSYEVKGVNTTTDDPAHFQERARVMLENTYYNPTEKINAAFPFKCMICEPELCSDKPDALVLVNTRPDSFQQRQAIRDTWGLEVREGHGYGRSLSENVAVGFVIGLQNNKTLQTQIELESNIYHDIIQGDFIDHYTNLTFKSLLAMNWTEKYCSGAKYFIKSDDDMVINFPYLFQVLNQGKFNKSIMGPHLAFSYVIRHGGKWSLTEKEFPLNIYPPYESGSAYVMTMDLIHPLLTASQYYAYFSIDDAYITGILAKHVKANHVIKSGFSYPNTPKPTPCDFIEDKRFTGTNFAASDMRIFWNILKNTTCARPNMNNNI